MLISVKLLLNARPLWLPRVAACLTLLFCRHLMVAAGTGAGGEEGYHSR